jgi:superfamily II DNA or RNA helicase
MAFKIRGVDIPQSLDAGWTLGFPHLRQYQKEAISDLVLRWDSGATRVPMVLATGLGKTEIFSPLEGLWVAGNEYTAPLHEEYGLGARVLVIAHTDELIEQAARKARQRNPALTVGIVKAGLNQAHAQIVVSSRQTLASEKRRSALRNVGLIIVDEAHHALRSNTYGRILEHFGAFDDQCHHAEQWPRKTCRECIDTDLLSSPRVKVAGFTATLARGDKGKLSTVWEDCTFRRDILFGIRHGYLLDVRGQRVIVPDMNMGNVRTQGGDFQDASLAEELERTFAPQIIADKYAEVARTPEGDLRSGIAFWPLVETAYHGAEAFDAAGISSAVVHGGLPKEERRLILKRFQAGEITVIHNCMVLTEGFDAPWADVCVIARPTRSAPLYQQMVGRVLRPDLTKPSAERGKALILDVVGAGQDHDLRSLIDLSPEHPLSPELEDEGFSLLELDDAYAQTAAELDDITFVHDGPTAVVEFDPLHREKVWDQTPDGVFYMSAGSGAYVFLDESEPALWNIVWCTKSGAVKAGLAYDTALPLEEALVLAEDKAMEMGGIGSKTLASRGSRWRKEEPTEAQLRMARGKGIDPTGMNKGEVSEAIDKVIAARRIDPLMRAVRIAREQGVGT